MEYIVVCLVAFIVSGLTLFSGFGLGTLLMPAFALFFPIPVAVTATAVVHLANNFFKLGLIGRHADLEVTSRFAIPATITAFLGALLLTRFSDISPLITYQIGDQTKEITVIKIVISCLIIIFAFFDLLPRLRNMAFDRKYLPLGGALSGFFGGLSGHQGALRSAFLIKAGLSKEAFIGTGVAAAVIVDIARLAVYGVTFYSQKFTPLKETWVLVLLATLSAFIGALLGRKLLKKITLQAVQVLVGVMLILLGLAMGTGLI